MPGNNNRINKARYWIAVLYQTSTREDWREVAEDVLQLPCAYCEHTLDRDEKSEHRTDHVHMILAFPNTTTYKHALEVFNLLSNEGNKAANTCQACVSVRKSYDYLIHDTKTCREQGKHLYDPSSRILGNNFDIGSYEQVSQEDKNRILRDMLDFIKDNYIMDIMTFYENYSDKLDDAVTFDVFKSYGSLIEKVCKGNYQKWCKGTLQTAVAPDGSPDTEYEAD